MPQSEEEVTGDEAAAVFRRAAELDQVRGGMSGRALDLAALEQAGAEAGLSREAIRQALAEVKAGAAVEPTGAPDAVVTRTLRGRADAFDDEVEDFMRKQKMRVARRYGNRTVWEQDKSFVAQMVRGFDINKNIVLRELKTITTCVVPVPGSIRPPEPAGSAHFSHVRFEIDFGATKWGWYSIPLSTAGVTIAGLAVMAGVGVDPVGLMVGVPTGAVLTGGAYVGARVGYRNGMRKSVNGIERFLDRLEFGR